MPGLTGLPQVVGKIQHGHSYENTQISGGNGVKLPKHEGKVAYRYDDEKSVDQQDHFSFGFADDNGKGPDPC